MRADTVVTFPNPRHRTPARLRRVGSGRGLIYGSSVADHSIQTERLVLRRWTLADIEPFASICADPEVMRYIGSGATRTVEETRRAIRAWEREWDQKGYGLFAVELLETGQLIGFAGLAEPTFLPEIMPAVEIGWRLARSAWAKGYATEAATAALRFGLDDLHLPEIVSIHQVGNDASAGVMRKIGMTFDRETVDPSCGRTVHVFKIKSDE
jgi:RimJ/RimL family protein N-acetyltransferase